MKHKILPGILCACALALGLLAAPAEAAAVEKTDGILCIDGNPDYPLYDTGNKLGSAMDIPDSCISEETDDYTDVRVVTLVISYASGEVTQDSQPLLLRYDHRDGTILKYNRFKDAYLPAGGMLSEMFADAFALLCARLGI